MSTNKKFRIQNGVDVTGELTVNDVVIIRADGTIVAGAIADAVASLVDEGALTGSGSSIIDSDSQIFIDVNSNTVAIASETATRISDIANLQTQIDSLGVNADTQAEVDSLQSQIDSIVGASPETLDTLVEIVSAFEGADSDIQALLAANSSSLSANTAAIGVETTQRIAGDVTLQQNIDAEVTRATAAEQVNAAAIAAEAATRGAAVSALQASQFTYNDSDGWTGNLIPSADNQYALGSPDRVWKDLYIGPGSLYINGTKILEDNSGTITMYADAGQNLSFGATGGGNIDLNAGDESVQLKSDLVMSVGETISTVGGAPTKFGGDVDMGTHQVSNLGAPVDPSDAATKEYVDGLNAQGTISGDKVFEDNVTIQGNLSVEGTTTTLDTQTLTVADNIIDLNSNVSTGVPTLNAGIRIMRGDEPAVQLRWNELEDRWEVYDGVTATPIAVESSDVITEGSNNLFFTVVRARDAVSQDIADAVAAEAASRGAAIDAEIARATSAEAQLAADIAAEATARAEADSDEAAARIAGDATLQSAIDTEQAARIAADLSEAQTRAAAVDDLQAQLNSVTGGDLSSIQSQIDAIVGTSPETLDTIQEVVAAFEGADSDLTSLITGNSSTITAVNQSLTQEVADRTFAVAAEKQQREDADSDLQSAIDSLSATVSSNNAAKSSAISTETAARIAGDEGEAASREAAITAEATARVAGDATVQAAVDAEAARATAAEQANASAISAEETRALAAEADLQNQINQVEATGATHPLFSTLADLPDASANHGMFAHVHAEGAAYFAHAGQWVKLANFSDLDGIDLSSIQSQIDAILGSSPETLDTLQEIVAAFESADGDLQALMTANASSISDLESYAGHIPQTVTIPERIFTALRSQKIVMMDMDGSNVFTHASDLRLGPNGQPSNYTNYGKHLASNGNKIAVAMDMATWYGAEGKVILSNMDGSNEIEIQGTDWVGAPNSLAMSDHVLYVGHNQKDDSDSPDAGAVHIYNLAGGFVKTIANRYDGVLTGDQEFGTTVTYNKDANKLVVSATVNNGNGYSSYIGIYDEYGNLERYIDDPAGADAGTRFGISVAMTSDKVIVGSYGPSSDSSENGVVYIFNLSNGSLVTTMTGPTITPDMLGGTRQNTSWGYEVSTNGSKIFVGSQTESYDGVDFKGAVYVYDMNGNFETKITPSVTTNQFGMNIMAGTNHVVVAEYNDPKIYVYDLDGSNEQIITVDEASSGFVGSFEAGIVIIPETQVTLDAISLDTTATTLAGAINELHAEMADNSATSAAVQVETDARVAAISAEETARIAGDAVNANAIVDEANARAAADTAETQARISADNSLQTQIDAETAARESSITSQATLISAQSTALNTEISNRTSADADLQTQIDDIVADNAARTASGATTDEVDAVQSNLDAEVVRAQLAEQANASAIVTGDAALQAQLDAIVGTSPETLDTLQEIVTAYSNADSTLQGLIDANSGALQQLQTTIGADNVPLITPDIGETITYDVEYAGRQYYAVADNYNIHIYDNLNPSTPLANIYRSNQYLSNMDVNSQGVFAVWSGANSTVKRYDWADLALGIVSETDYYTAEGRTINTLAVSEDYIFAQETYSTNSIWSQPISSPGSTGRTRVYDIDSLYSFRMRVLGDKLYALRTTGNDALWIWQINSDGSLTLLKLLTSLDQGSDHIGWGQGTDHGGFDASSTIIAVGAYSDEDANSGSNQNAGSVYLYNPDNLEELATKLYPPSMFSNLDHFKFGWSVAATDTRLIVSALDSGFNNNAVSGSNGIILIYDAINMSLPPLVVHPPVSGINDFGYRLHEESNRLFVGTSDQTDGVYVYDLTNMDQSPVHLTEPNVSTQSGVYGRLLGISPAATVTQTITDTIIPAQGLGNSINYLESQRQKLRADLDANLAAIQSNDADIASIAADVATNTANIATNAAAIVAVDADRTAFEASVQAQVDQVNADRTAFEASVNAGRDSHEAATLALATAFRDSVENDVINLTSSFQTSVDLVNQTAAEITARHGDGVLDFPNEATTITYDKTVPDQFWSVKAGDDEFLFYSSVDFSYSSSDTLNKGIRVPMPDGLTGTYMNETTVLTREYFIASNNSVGGKFYVYDMSNIGPASTPIAEVTHDGFSHDLTYDHKDGRFIARYGNAIRAWDIASLAAGNKVYIEADDTVVPEGHDVSSFAGYGVAMNTNHVFVSSGNNVITVLNRSDLSFVTCITNSDNTGQGSQYFGRYLSASDTMLVSSGRSGYSGSSYGNDYSGGSNSHIWVYDANDFTNYVKVNGKLTDNDGMYDGPNSEWRMTSISNFNSNRQIAVNDDLVFVRVWGRWAGRARLVGLRRTDIFNGSWYNNYAFLEYDSYPAYRSWYVFPDWQVTQNFCSHMSITNDKLLVESRDTHLNTTDDGGSMLVVYDLTATPVEESDSGLVRIDRTSGAQIPQILEEANDGSWVSNPELSPSANLVVSVTETFTPDENLTSAINYIHNKNQELETLIANMSGTEYGTLLSDLQAIEGTVDFKLLAQDQRFDSDKAEQTAIYAAANAEQAAIYDSANAAHVAYFEQYTVGETAARELADQNLQTQIASNDGDIASLQSQIDTIVGTSPETLDTLQELVSAYENADNSLHTLVSSNNAAHEELDLFVRPIEQNFVFNPDPQEIPSLFEYTNYSSSTINSENEWLVNVSGIYTGSTWHSEGQLSGGLVRYINLSVVPNKEHKVFLTSKNRSGTLQLSVLNAGAPHLGGGNGVRIAADAVGNGSTEVTQELTFTPDRSDVILFVTAFSTGTYTLSDFYVTEGDGQPYTLETQEQGVVPAINELHSEIGNDTLSTSSQTLSGAINELKSDLDPLSNPALETAATDVVGAINELNTSLQSITGSDTQFLDDIATNQTDIATLQTDLGAIDTRVTTAEAAINTNSGNIATEVADRTAGDAALQAQIDNIVGTSPETLDTLQEVVAAFEGADDDLQALITGNTSIVSTHTTQIATLDDQIHGGAGLNVPNMPTQVSRWVYQDQYIVAISNRTDDLPYGGVLVFDANNPLSAPTVLSPEGVNGPGSAQLFQDMSIPRTAKIVRDKVVVGYPYAEPGNNTNAGQVYVWDLNDLSADPVVLNRYNFGISSYDYFGWSVTGSSDHNYIIVGEWGQENTGGFDADSGRVYLYDINDLTSQPIILDPHGMPSFYRNTSYGDDNIRFGRQVNVDGDYLYVTAEGFRYYGGSNYNPFIAVYDLRNIQQAPTFLMPSRTTWSDDQDNNQFGVYSNSVAFNDNYVAVGAQGGPYYSFDGLTQYRGTVYVWAKNADGYAEGEGTHVYAIQSPDSQSYDYFGRSVDMDDTRLYVGSYGWDGVQGNSVGKVDVFDLSDGSYIQTIYAYDGNANDYFGYNLTVNGGKLVVSAHGDDDSTSDSGSLYIYDTSALSGIPIKVSEAFASIDTNQLGTIDLDLTVASGAVEIIETILPNASLSDGINYLESKTEELKVQVQNVNNSGALTAMSNSNRLDVVETEMDLLESADSAEQAARIAGDASLQTQIDNLTIAASGDVSVESAARIAGDSDEAAARVAGDATVQAAVDAEVARATGVESGLQSQLDAIVGTSPETLDTLQEVVAAFEGADGDLQTLITTNASTISDLDTFVKGEVGAVGPELGLTPNVNVVRQYSEAQVFDLSSLEVGKTYEFSYVVSADEYNGTPVIWPNGSQTIVMSGKIVESSSISANPDFTDGYQVVNVQSGVSAANTPTQSVSRTFTATTTDYSLMMYPTVQNWPMFVHSVSLKEYVEPVSLETTETTVVSAINEVHSELNAEVLRAQTAEGAEEVRALAAEAVLQSNINTESSARLAGDAGLQSQIDTLSGTQTSDKSALEVSIAAETARATGAENTLQSNIDAEATRAQTAEAANAAAVVTEKVRAEAVEAGLAADIAVETARATAAEAQLANHLGANFTDGSITVDGLATFNGGLYFGDGTGTIGFNSSVDHLQVLSDLDMMSNSVINVAAPVDSADAANKAYVDATTQVVSDRVDAILNGAGESLDTIVEVVAAFENADSDIQALITSNSASVTANTNAINAEVAARQQAIIDEATARANADSDLSAGLSNETSRALSAEGVLTSDLAAEVARATSAETGLASDIAAEASRATAAEGVNATAISAETTRATTVEASLAQDIADEALRAQGAEAVLTSDVSANATAISNLQTQVAGVSTSSGSSTIEMTAEVDMKSNKITGMADPTAAQDAATKSYVDASVATEATARTTEDTSLQSNIDAANARIDAILNGSVESLDTVVEVVSAFEGADSDIQNLITANASTISQNATAIANEATARANADSDEAALRTAADAVLTADLAAEVARATAAETSLQSQIDTADSDLTASLAAEVARAQAAESAETSARIAADSDLQTQIDFIKENTDPSALDSLTELVSAFQDADSDVTTMVASNASAIAATNARTAGISVDSDSNIEMSVDVEMGQNNIRGVNDVYAARGFIDTIESGSLTVQTGTVDFSGSTVNFGSSTLIGSGFGTATKNEIDQHLNKSAAGTNEFLKWNGSDYEFTDYIEGQLATNMITVEGTLRTEQPGSTIDWQNGLVHFGGSQVIVDEPSAPTEAANKRYVDEADSDLNALLSTAISNEESRATTAEGVLTTNLTNEISRATSAEAGLASDISAEETRALAAEAAEASARADADSDLQSAIDAEVARATAAEGVNAQAVADEATARTAADTTLQSNIDTVSGRVDAILNGSSESLDTIVEVVAAFENADSDLQTLISSNAGSHTANAAAIVAEETRALAAEGVLQSAIDAEETRATGVESSLQSQITSEIAARSAADQSMKDELDSDIAAEAALRAAGDASLQSGLDVEVARATAAEGVLQSLLDSEQSARLASDQALQSAVTAEENARVAADAVLQSAIDAEVAARTSADNTLQANINAVDAAVTAITNGSPETLNQLVEVVAAFENADSDIQTLISNLGGDASALTARVSTLEGEMDATELATTSNANAISAETAARVAAVQANADAITAEATARAAAIVAEQNARSAAIAASESDRDSADADLQAQITALSTTEQSSKSSLQALLSQEVADRTAGDSDLTDSLAAEVARATAAESALSTDISDEASARATADASLQTQIDNILSNTDATALNSLAEIVTEFQSVDGTLTGLINSNGSRITALETSVGTIEGWTTDNVSEGSINKYWTEQRTKDCLTGGLCIDYNSTTGEIAIDEAEAATSLTVAEAHDANALDGQAPSYYRINVYDAAGNLVN